MTAHTRNEYVTIKRDAPVADVAHGIRGKRVKVIAKPHGLLHVRDDGPPPREWYVTKECIDKEK